MSNFYPNNFSFTSIESIKKRLNKIQNLLNSYADSSCLHEINLDDIDKITAEFFEINIELLSASEENERNSGAFYDASYERICTQNIPVSINFNGNALRIKTPLTIKRKDSKSQKVAKENYLLQTLVNAKLNNFEDKNPEIKGLLFEAFSGKYLDFYIVRYSNSFSKNIHCDNDNIEQSRVQNLICSFAGISDRADKMDIHLCFRKCLSKDDCGTEFILTERTNGHYLI